MSRAKKKVVCPDCGQEFLPRGLASHRRQKHGPAQRSTDGGPEEASRFEATLARILGTLERLEQQLGQLGAPGAGPDERLLRARLEEVCAQVRAVEAERATIEGDWADARRKACDLELGRLRRQQVRILYELEELDEAPF